MAIGFHEGSRIMDSAPGSVLPADVNYARQMGLDPTILADPEALERLRRVRVEDRVGGIGVQAAEIGWMLENTPVVHGRLDFSN